MGMSAGAFLIGRAPGGADVLAGVTASVANFFIKLQLKEFGLFDQQLIFGHSVYGIWASANKAVQVTEHL